MGRYEGVDRVLQGVRQHLDKTGAHNQPSGKLTPLSSTPEEALHLAAADRCLGLLHESEELRRLLLHERLNGFTREQRHDLAELLSRMLHELEACLRALGASKAELPYPPI